MRNPKVFLDIQAGNRVLGRVVIEVFADLVPKTSENFRALCTGEYGRGRVSGEPLSYLGCKIYRVVAGQYIESGDFVNNDGTGGESIYGESFRDENFILWHAHAGVVSMANDGPHSNKSRFLISLKKCAALNRHHVVFGQVRGGMEILRAIEALPTDASNRPRVPICIVGCGETFNFRRTLPPADEESAAAKGRSILAMLAEGDEESDKATKSDGEAQLISEEDASSGEDDSPSSYGEESDADAEASGKSQDTAPETHKLQEQTSKDCPASALGPQTEEEARLGALRSFIEESSDLNEQSNLLLEKQRKSVNAVFGDSNKRAWSDPDFVKNLTAAKAEKRAKAAARKKIHPGPWNPYNAESVYKAHEKKISALRLNEREYNKQKATSRPSEFYQEEIGCAASHEPCSASKERLEQVMQPKKTRVRRRRELEVGDVDYISRKNREFNRRLNKVFGHFTVEIKQNIERGTAL